jgi:hypothetical protein
MIMKLIKAFLSILPIFFLSLTLSAQPGKVKQAKLSEFQLQSSFLVSQSGEQLSTGDYKKDIYWMPVTVPSTVLTGLVAK